MKSLILLAIAVLLAFVEITASAAEQVVYPTLAETRSEISLPETSRADRILILDQVRRDFAEVYVNGPMKIEKLGEAGDVPGRMTELASRIDSMSAEEFHLSISAAILGLHDAHSLYIMPEPRNCYYSFLPVQFELIYNEDGSPSAAVSAILGSLKGAVGFGDKLLSYNGRTVKEAIDEVAADTRWASLSSRLRESVVSLGMRKLGYSRLPEEDVVTLRLMSRTTGRKYEIALPWQIAASGSSSCIAKVPARVPHLAPSFDSPPMAGGEWIPTKMDMIRYKWIKTGGKNAAVIQLTGFAAKNGFDYLRLDGSELEFDRAMADLFGHELAAADAIIIDARNNPGGDAWIASDLASFFSDKRVDLQWRLRNSDLVKSLTHLEYPQASQPYFGYEFYFELTRPVFSAPQPYTVPTSIETLEVAPKEYREYSFPRVTKPVGVLSNGACYSACDIFVQGLVGTDVVRFGEDQSTGGGTGERFPVAPVFGATLPGAMEALGFKLLPDHADIWMTLRQTVYPTKDGFDTYEGTGVPLDHFLQPSADDVMDGGVSEYRKIAEELLK